MDTYRLQRVANLLRERISEMIAKQEIKDPRVTSLVSITNIQVAKDLSFAKVFVSSFESREKLQSAVDGLNHAAGFIQGVVGKKIKLRLTPRLSFVADHAIEEGFHVTELIKDALS